MVSWRLVYPDDSVIDEPDIHPSIRYAKAGASALVVMHDGKPLVAVKLDPKREKPIYYWRRYRIVGVGGLGDPGTRTEAIVFGRAHETLNGRVEGTVWLLRPDGKVVDCPQALIDRKAIELAMREVA